MLDNIIGIVDSIGKLIPRLKLITARDGGVKFKRAGKVKILTPGLYMYWPVVTTLEVYPVKRQVLNLPYQSLMTKDLKPIISAGVIVYTIEDLYKYAVENYDSIEAITEMGCAAIRSVIITKTLAELQSNNSNTIDNALTKSAQQEFASFGINVLYVRLTDFSTAKVLNLVGGEPFTQKHSEANYTFE